jgi:diaminobutyrate-2-oxoglutarate transaminase
MTQLQASELSRTAAFEELESAVRSYCRSWPAVFDRASGSWLYDESGKPFLDFFMGAGALNYGHNNALLKQVVVEYLSGDRIVHSLDMFTVAKREFLEALEGIVLGPRGLSYRIQFPGPAGTNAVEAALKLARKATGRTNVVCFTKAFHGATLGALALSGNPLHRGAAGVPLEHATCLPYDDPDLGLLEALLEAGDTSKPAAVILETVQGEGGVNVAHDRWLRALAERCAAHAVPLIVDDIQMGCGRTGPFFSFEAAGIVPDIVCLSKSISGYGLPLALTLIRPELDVWEPGEHNGTFRGFDPAFAAGAAALRAYWSDGVLERASLASGRHIAAALAELAVPGLIEPRGRGMVHGLAFAHPELAGRVRAAAFELGLLVETAGHAGEVLKLLPSLTVSEDELDLGLALLAEAVRRVTRT